MDNLVVFDFDNTLIDGNTDSVIIDMFPDLRKLTNGYRSNGKGWGEAMNEVLNAIKENHGGTRLDIDDCIFQLKITNAVKDILTKLCESNKSDLVIISHSNQYFIEVLLNAAGIGTETFKNIYTYPAEWNVNGCLRVTRYHSQIIECKYCPNDFCKGHVLSNAIQKLEQEQSKMYATKIYVGDGKADFCAALKLGKKDYVLCREGYSLHKVIIKSLNENKSCLEFPQYKTWNSFEDMGENLSHIINT